MTVVAITGAGGFIGSHLARRLTAEGHAVVGIDRQPPGRDVCEWSYQRSFGMPLDDLCERHRPQVAIHCAYDMTADAAERNERGTRQWAEQMRAASVSRQIFFSSISARPGATAIYGQLKYRLEQWFLQWGGVVVRPGLVIGRGGLFARMVNVVRRFPVVPLIDGGRSRVYFTGVDFLADTVAQCVRGQPAAGAWNLQQPKPTSMRLLLGAICDVQGIRRWFLPVPYAPCLFAAWALQRSGGLGLGIRTENLKGLRQNDHADLPSDFSALGGRPEEIRALVERALADPCPCKENFRVRKVA